MGWLATKLTLVESLLDSRTTHWLGNLGQDSSSLTQTLELQKNSGGAPEGTRKVSSFLDAKIWCLSFPFWNNDS